MRKLTEKKVILSVIFTLALLFVVRFAGNRLLQLYIETGIGNCTTIPILCQTPQENIANPEINKDYLRELAHFEFSASNMEILLPKSFSVYKGQVNKVYFKKWKLRSRTPVAYLLYRKPGFFINLFPQLSKINVKNDYEFVTRTMNAKLTDIQGITDTFFVIMKGIFTPDLGNQKNLQMITFSLGDKKGFINYCLSPAMNYFDCTMFDANGAFLKLYIKDIHAQLDLNKVFTIISSLKAGSLSDEECNFR